MSFDGSPLPLEKKTSGEYFKQYRIMFNQSLDSMSRLPSKKAEDEENPLQQELSSLVHNQLDKAGVSPVHNSRQSNVSETNRNFQSDTNVIKAHLGPYSTSNVNVDIEIQPTQQLTNTNNPNANNANQNSMNIPSHLVSNFRSISVSNNHDLELDYSSINPGSNNRSNTLSINQQPGILKSSGYNEGLEVVGENHLESHDIESRGKPSTQQNVNNIPQQKKHLQQQLNQIIQQQSQQQQHKNHDADFLAASDDLDDHLLDSNFSETVMNFNNINKQPADKSMRHSYQLNSYSKQQNRKSLTEKLRNSFRKVFHFMKVESLTINVPVLIEESQYRLINDLASDVSFLHTDQYDSIFFKILNKLFTCCAFSKSLQPSSTIIVCLDLVSTLIIAAWMMVLSMHLFMNLGAFEADTFDSLNIIRIIAQIVFIVDLFKNMLTGYFCNGLYQNDIIHVLHRYIKNVFVFDLVPIAAIALHLDDLESVPQRLCLSILYLPKFISFYQCTKRLQLSWSLYSGGNSTIRLLIRLLVVFCVAVHVFAIIYHGIGLIDLSQEGSDAFNSWIGRLSLQNSHNVWQRYLSAITMCAIHLTGQSGGGYSLERVSQLEQLFITIVCFTSLLVSAFFFSEVLYVVKCDSGERTDFHEEKRRMGAYMRSMSVDSSLQEKISNYLDYRYWKTKDDHRYNLTLRGVMQVLPTDLQADLFYAVKSKYLPYFGKALSKFSQQTRTNIFRIIEEISYAPGDLIFSEGDHSVASALYVVVSGKVEIFHPNAIRNQAHHHHNQFHQQHSTSTIPTITAAATATMNNNNSLNSGIFTRDHEKETKLCSLRSGFSFGEVSFFTDLAHSASARCSEFTRVVRIERSKFIQLLHETNQEEDFEMMCMLRDEVLFKKNFKAINARCCSCARFGHLAKSCKLIHFYPLKAHIIQTRTINYTQSRKADADRRKRSDQIIDLVLIESRLKKFLIDNNDEIDEYVERYFPGQSNQSDYLPSSQSGSTNQQSSHTEILSEKLEPQEQLHGSHLELPQPFNTNFRPSANNTLNESSLLRQAQTQAAVAAAAGSSKTRHKDSSDSQDMGIKGRKDSAQTRNSNDSFIKHKNTGRSSNKQNSPIEIIMKVDTLPIAASESSNKRKGSSSELSQATDQLFREKTLKSQKTRGTQKTNKSGSSLYRNKFEHSSGPVQRADSRNSHSSIQNSPHKFSPQLGQQNLPAQGNLHIQPDWMNLNILFYLDTMKIVVPSGKSSMKSGGGGTQSSANVLQSVQGGSSLDNTDSEQNFSYELVLPKIELIMNAGVGMNNNNNMNSGTGKQQQQQIGIGQQDEPMHSNFSSMILDQQSSFSSQTEQNNNNNNNNHNMNLLSHNLLSPFLDSQLIRPFSRSQQGSQLEFDCMKNFKIYNTKSNVKNVLAHAKPMKSNARK